jgi:ferredoxin
MIVGQRKPLEEVVRSLAGAHDVLVVGCGGCVAVCLAGGQQETALAAAEIRLALALAHADVRVTDVTIQRQCDEELVDGLVEAVEGKDAVLSLACGAGVQLLAQRFAPLRVAPGLNTDFIGVTLERGAWAERCQACGDCVLDLTGGICPIARCSKSLLNGPCGGSSGGHCEIDPSVECAWQLIYDRLKAQGRLHQIYEVIEPKDWRTSRDGGPRRVVRAGAERERVGR